MFSDILQASFPKLKVKIMDVIFLPGNLLRKAWSQPFRELGSFRPYQTCQFLVIGAPNTSTGQSVRRRGSLHLAGNQRREEGRETKKGRRRQTETIERKTVVGHQERRHPHH